MYKKIILSALAVMCAAMTACTAANNTEDTVSETESITEIVTSAGTDAQTTTLESAALTTSEAEEIEIAETEEIAETAAYEESDEAVQGKITASRFTDFAFIEYYKGTKESGEIGDKAVEFLKTTDEYAQTQKYSDIYKEKYSEYFDKNGVLVPKFHESFTEDFDCDGKKETFLLVDIPYGNSINENDPASSYSMIYSFLIFADSEGNMENLGYYGDLYPAQFIDYGFNKQLIIGGSGSCGAEDHTNIWTVRNGKPADLLWFRGTVYKQDCFLSMFGWQSYGATLWFDPEQLSYVTVGGVECDNDEIRKMDTDKTIECLYDENGYAYILLIGGKYYCLEQGMMDWGTIYTYNDGAFVLDNRSALRSNHMGSPEDCPELGKGTLVDFDYDKAVSEMVKVEAKMPSYTVDDIGEYTMERLKTDYAEFVSDDKKTYTADDVEAAEFFGCYNNHYAVKMSGSSEVLIYVPFSVDHEERFWSVDSAYENGVLSEYSFRQLNSLL